MRRADLLLILGLSALWGTAFMFITLGLDRFSPFLFAAFRFDITGAILLALALARRKGTIWPTEPNQWAAILVAAVLMTCSYHAFLFWGQQYTTPSVAAVIVGLSPVLTTIFSRALLREERVGTTGLLGLGVGFLGIVLLASLKGGAPLDQRGLGELAVVAAIASWALGSVLVKKAKHRMDVLAFAAWQSLIGALMLHALSFATEGRGRMVFDRDGLLSLLYLSVASSGIGFIIYFTLVEHVGPIRVNLVSYLAPIFATLAGILVLHNPFEWRAFFAFVLIVAGFAFVARAPKNPSEPEDPRRVAPEDLLQDPVLPRDLPHGGQAAPKVEERVV